jgi:hemerythrin superfamily protein
LAENTDIFARLIEDHQLHRELFAQLGDASGAAERTGLLERLTIELKGHAAAEEQALYSTMLRKPETTDETRHSVAEHKEIEDLLNDLAAADTSSDEWTAKFEHLRHRYTHHIDEEEEENFPDYSQYLDEDDLTYMRSVFERRKRAEASQAEVTPEKLEEAQE